MLVQANCVKRALNTAGLTLQADIGESLLVKGISVGIATTAGYLIAKIDNFTVGCWRILGRRGNHLGGQRTGYKGVNLMKQLIKRGLPFKYPIAEGQKLTIAALDGAGSIQVDYDIYTAGDILPTLPNGTQSRNFSFIQYMDTTTVLAASGDMLLDKSLTPAEFPDFPAGKAVPARMKIKLHGIIGSPVADAASGSNLFYTTYLKMIREREVLLDEDRLGLQFLGDSGASGAADYTDAVSLIGTGAEAVDGGTDYKWDDPYWFEPPLVFNSGEELDLYLSWTKVGTHTMPADIVDVGLILEVNRE
jgi:hypothetical protein